MKVIKLQRDPMYGGVSGSLNNIEHTTEETKKEPVQIVTIKNVIPLFRDGQPALGIEMIELEEFGYNLISQKGLYKPGDKAVYIMPDYSLSDIPLFDSFIRPGGDEKKCRLGSKNRIRAIKFNNFYRDGYDENCVFSNGILMPYSEVCSYIHFGAEEFKPNLNCDFDNGFLDRYDLTSELGIVKWEEPEVGEKGGINGGGTKTEFPTFLYKTDEESCLDKDTFIETSNGKQTIEEVINKIALGECIEVLSFNDNTKNNEYKKIYNTSIKNNINNWYKITLEDNTELIVTDNHKIYIPKLNCYRRVKDLVIGDILLQN